MAPREYTTIEVAGREVRVSSPSKVYFPERGFTKLDLIEYYVECSDAVLRGVYERPTTLKRWRDGVAGDFFYQKRLPPGTPEWLESCLVTFPSGRTATELCPTDAAHLVWAANLGNIDFNPWPSRRSDVEHPDELRVDIDRDADDVPWSTIRDVAMCVRDVLEEYGCVGWPKTSGSKGFHVYVRLEAGRYGFLEVRRAALALAREVERRMPDRATSKWWKEERPAGAAFIDYNRNARDHTVASAYSVRAVPDAKVSCGVSWDEVPDVEAEDFRLDTVPQRLREVGDPIAAIDDHPCSLDGLLDLSHRDEDSGLGDAPWPPHFPKMPGEPKRVQPSRAKNAE